ncbi:hypothetical protein [Parahaliea mediterranea]|uniref:Uncharacterized protein n=1 Tax=Parahaliea mediterranea TaxID=651086 RepID=A0A939IN84_9GAMM|nr:hypothetical protein [Parahaliea mediterranea]MBN7798300.1 hypothetical protein [Parahaliea mediterranea]
MPTRYTYLMRQLAALLITASGLWQIAGLWLGELDAAHLLTALVGAAYLLIGLGLFGQSRFTLFVAIALPAAMLWLALSGNAPWTSPPWTEATWTTANVLRGAVDALVIALSARVLWALRHQPSI